MKFKYQVIFLKFKNLCKDVGKQIFSQWDGYWRNFLCAEKKWWNIWNVFLLLDEIKKLNWSSKITNTEEYFFVANLKPGKICIYLCELFSLWERCSNLMLWYFVKYVGSSVYWRILKLFQGFFTISFIFKFDTTKVLWCVL